MAPSGRIRIELSFASLREQGSPELLRRGLFPTSKGVAEIRGLAETQRMRDVVDRHFRIAQVFYRNFRAQLIEQFTKRRILQAQFAAQRSDRRVEVGGDVVQARVSAKRGKQKLPHLSRDADPMLQLVLKVLAEAENRRIGYFIAELRRAIQPAHVIFEAIFRLPEDDRTAERVRILFLGL